VTNVISVGVLEIDTQNRFRDIGMPFFFIFPQIKRILTVARNICSKQDDK